MWWWVGEWPGQWRMGSWPGRGWLGAALLLLKACMRMEDEMGLYMPELAHFQLPLDASHTDRCLHAIGPTPYPTDDWVQCTSPPPPAAGCLGFVLALLASGRLIYAARQRRKVCAFHLLGLAGLWQHWWAGRWGLAACQLCRVLRRLLRTCLPAQLPLRTVLLPSHVTPHM